MKGVWWRDKYGIVYLLQRMEHIFYCTTNALTWWNVREPNRNAIIFSESVMYKEGFRDISDMNYV